MATDNRQRIAMSWARLWHSSSGHKPLSHTRANLRPWSRLPGNSSREIPRARTTTKPERAKYKESP
eukprot:852633-Pyramimonas_sp.AAC.1